MQIIEAVSHLLKVAATDLPPDVEAALRKALRTEENPRARSALELVLENCRIARRERRPICQDTGLPIFFVTAPVGSSHQGLVEVLRQGVRRATEEVPLRPNAVDPLTGANTGDGVGDGVPIIYYSQWQQDYTLVELLLKGGGSENVGADYKLPDRSIGAARDLDGVRRAVLDAVFAAQGRGCPPYFVGVGVAGTKDDAAVLAKRQLLRPLDERNERPTAAKLEERLLCEINELGIGPSGLSGATTAFAVKAGFHARHPATFFVHVAFGCWAHRRRRLRFHDGEAVFE